MASEIFLTAAIQPNATTINVSDIPPTFGPGNYSVNIEGDHFYINSVSGKTLTVTPNVDGTTSRYHAQGSVVSIVAGATPSNTRILTKAGPYAMRDMDWYLEVNLTTPAAISITSPPRPITGQPYTVFDGAGNAATYPITIVNYKTGATLGTISTNKGSVTFVDDGL